jgi:hypothetical protein
MQHLVLYFDYKLRDNKNGFQIASNEQSEIEI